MSKCIQVLLLPASQCTFSITWATMQVGVFTGNPDKQLMNNQIEVIELIVTGSFMYLFGFFVMKPYDNNLTISFK